MQKRADGDDREGGPGGDVTADHAPKKMGVPPEHLLLWRMRQRHAIKAMASRRTTTKYRMCELIHRTNLSMRR